MDRDAVQVLGESDDLGEKTGGDMDDFKTKKVPDLTDKNNQAMPLVKPTVTG